MGFVDKKWLAKFLDLFDIIKHANKTGTKDINPGNLKIFGKNKAKIINRITAKMDSIDKILFSLIEL